MYLYHISFIHWSIKWNVGSFHTSDIGNNAAVSTGVQTTLWDSGFMSFIHIPRSGVARSCGSSVFNFLRKIHTVSHSRHINLHSHHQCTGFPFLHILTNTYLLSFCCRHPDRWEVISHCGFDFHFSDDYWWWLPFSTTIGLLYFFFGKMSTQVLCLLFLNYIIWGFVFFCFCCWILRPCIF